MNRKIRCQLPKNMGIAQLLNRQRDEIADDERRSSDRAETAEGDAGAFGIGANEICDVRRHRQHVARLILAEEQRMVTIVYIGTLYRSSV